MLHGCMLNRDETFCGINLIKPMNGIFSASRCTLSDVVHSHGHQGFDPRKSKVMSWTPQSANKLWRSSATRLQTPCIALGDSTPTFAPGEVRPLGRRQAKDRA